MSNQDDRNPEADESTDTSSEYELLDGELEDVAGGGPLYDAYLIIKDGWSDFKEGFSDAMND